MQMLPVRAEIANANPAPITEADRKRAAFFNLALPLAGPISGNSSHKAAAANEIEAAKVPAILPEPSMAVSKVEFVPHSSVVASAVPSGWGEIEADDDVPNVWDPGDSWDTWKYNDAPIGLGPDAEPIEPEAPAPTTRLAINGFQYSVRTIPVARECGTVAFELLKLETNNRYHVRRDEFGVISCDCPDYLMRHDGAGTCCKHGKALVARGLMPAPAPVPSTLGRRVFLSPDCSILVNATPTRTYYPLPDLEPSPAPPRCRRFVPSPEEMAEAAQLFAECEADRRDYLRQYAAAL